MSARPTPATASRRGRRILVLYDHHWLHIKTVADYLMALQRHSENEVYYATSFGPCLFDLDAFDAVVIHYSVKVCFPGHLSASYERALRRARCPKILFLQDEYEATNENCRAILDLGIRLVFTCVPDRSVQRAYPRAKFPGVRFVSILTGFVPLDFVDSAQPKPIRERSTLIGYRGRDIGARFGDLSREKLVIGMRMRALCDARGLKTDIEWAEDRRIYGDDWMKFLCSIRTTLGTESGSNVFDFDGRLERSIERERLLNPKITYEEIHERFLKGIDGAIVMNQISPKIFEAIASRTGLILFEGEYSNVIQPGTHYIPLKKDFSNFDEVIRLAQDDAYLEALTARAYDHVIASGKHSYEAFLRQFDAELRLLWPAEPTKADAWLPTPPCDTLASFRATYRRNWRAPLLARWRASVPAALRNPLRTVFNRDRWKRTWVLLPDGVRSRLRPMLRCIRGLLGAA